MLSKRDPPAQPKEVVPSGRFDGNDGPWSSFALSIGSPEQTIRVLASTSLPEIFVISSEGPTSIGECPTNTTTGLLFNGSYDCYNSRGGLFNLTASTTYHPEQAYNVGDYPAFGYRNITAPSGSDALTLSSSSDTTIILQRMGLAQLSDLNSSWLGLLGLDSGQMKNSRPSLIQNLKLANVIPSMSFGYTAGSVNRNVSSNASLVLGGYDQNRFRRNNVSFPFWEDSERALMVEIQSITISSNQGSVAVYEGKIKTALSAEGYLGVRVDSTRPYIILPSGICETIAQTLSLTYDSTTEHYLINKTTHEQNLKNNPVLTFIINPPPFQRSSNVSITLPYSSLALKLGFPIFAPGNESMYFPIRQGLSFTQHLLGRAFLQESYLVVDYERHSFSIHQVEWANPKAAAVSLIKPILPSLSGQGSTFEAHDGDKARSSELNSPKPRRHLSAIEILAIVLATIILITFICLAGFCFRRYSRMRKAKDIPREQRENGVELPGSDVNPPSRANEADSNTLHEFPTRNPAATELAEGTDEYTGRFGKAELAENAVFEMQGSFPARLESPIVASPIPQTPIEYYIRPTRDLPPYSILQQINETSQAPMEKPQVATGTLEKSVESPEENIELSKEKLGLAKDKT
ncbi:acid protease [Tothia fuscella]|uniref:Acid protease n=1 Tax=Tothia fuscella TaxID=1048955 RepID=A0A9P4U074_9PEZI|nr:acid protease [Tothia fuscella]